MKKILLLLLCLAVFLSGCSAANVKDDGRLRVVTTIFPIYDFVRAVGGDKVDLKLLIDPGTEVHTFDPAPSDVMSIYNCDCFFYIGGESDAWVDAVLADINVLPQALIDCVEPMQTHHKEHEHNHEHNDEHIWTSPFNARLMVKKIAEILSDADPKNTEIYSENADLYCDKIESVEREIQEIVRAAEDPFLLIADRNPYSYFADAFDIEYEAAFGGCSTSSDISLKTMKKLIETVENRQLKCAFYTEMSSKNIATALAEETGIKLYQLNSAHNVTKAEFENGITYVELMRQNAISLKKGWGV